ncbi:hypothetical protein TIFTF001_027278 [Ficus carica]|uniref:Uncharacterized protein n=1 Tax=Ficus carica TaxID=3494 RepID=A0AA88DMV1_FICCA|nr:hypothetical protein TIFTF001_027278 [Ficus carica]
MRRVHLVRKKGERIQVSFDAKGQPIGKEGVELQSWIGVLAREHISICNDEHSGRTRGQSKFVRHSHYFNIMQSSRDNAEVSVVKRKRAVLERTVHELCAKHDINRETMAEENTPPTVDQHNSFKAS